jgi:hypothetical protein
MVCHFRKLPEKPSAFYAFVDLPFINLKYWCEYDEISLNTYLISKK